MMAPIAGLKAMEIFVVGMDVAFIQNAQNDIDGDDRGQHQWQLVGERWSTPALWPGNHLQAGWHLAAERRLPNGGYRGAKRRVRGEIK